MTRRQRYRRQGTGLRPRDSSLVLAALDQFASVYCRGGRARRDAPVLVALLLGVMLAAGCSSAAGDTDGNPGTTAPTATTAAPPTTADPLAAARAAVLATYRAWWADVIAANRDPVGGYARLADHMAGDGLKTMQVFIIDRRHRGLVARGALKVGPPEIVALSRGRATVRGCVDATDSVDYQAGKLVRNSSGTVRSYRVGLTLAGGWKVTSFSSKESRCAVT
jgi:hypothetical protein